MIDSYYFYELIPKILLSLATIGLAIYVSVWQNNPEYLWLLLILLLWW
jgi:hypothetical protein